MARPGAGSRAAFVIDTRGREMAALIEIDIATREARLLAEGPEADIAGAVYDPGTGQPFAAFAGFTIEFQAGRGLVNGFG